jgi:hypothetical protein
VDRIIPGKLWRIAIALIAAYVLVIQGFLATVVVTEAAAAGVPSGNAVFEICSGDHGSAGGPPDGQASHLEKCCLVCTLAAATAAISPDVSAAPAWARIAAVGLPHPAVVSDGPVPPERVRSGPTRAPPRTA